MRGKFNSRWHYRVYGGFSSMKNLQLFIYVLSLIAVLIAVFQAYKLYKTISQKYHLSVPSEPVRFLKFSKKLPLIPNRENSNFQFINGYWYYYLHPEEKDIVTCGRDPDNDILIADYTVSKKHFSLIFHNDKWIIEDANSANGTYLNGFQIHPAETLYSGDIINIGNGYIGVNTH